MPRTAVRARRGDEEAATFARRIAWTALAGLWGFLVVALASFDSADWPSRAVAVHNEPTRNLCGPAGALVAFFGYYVLGVGVWLILAAGAGALALVAAGREVTHPVIRALGVVLMAVAVSSFHGLLFPETGPVSTAAAGLLAVVIVSELAGRFGEVGTFLVLLVAFGVGAVVAVDRLVLALGRAVGFLWGLARLRPAWVGALGARPDRAAPAPAGRGPRRRQAESDEEPEDAVPRRRLSAPELRANASASCVFPQPGGPSTYACSRASSASRKPVFASSCPTSAASSADRRASIACRDTIYWKSCPIFMARLRSSGSILSLPDMNSCWPRAGFASIAR